MNWKLMIMLCLLIVINFSCAQQEDVATYQPEQDKQTGIEDTLTNDSFVIGVGDELDITVWNNKDLASSVRVDPEGNINLHLVNEIKAEGLTLPQLQEVITARFSFYIKKPLVGINIVNLRSQKIHVLGEVKNPGTVMLESRMLLWEAISQVGGFSEHANLDRVILIRREGDTVKLTSLDMNIKTEKHSQQNMYLRSNDVLYVPPTTMTKVARFMNQFNEIINPILNLQAGVVLWPQLIDVMNGNSKDQTIVVRPN